ncbi:hypothetical protein CAEBREN_23167 [Caenorhabditis brenneri]|uniref:Uncharacterized protein n=1 Tax=Caenorhabditis brenneri TaxID=135651 RepID=G0N2H9_CAEBE|nr:hypothetical protein CAEBREN_23167 [Caenorhabditis brenneri]
MHEVKYDYELEKVASSMAGNCNFPKGNYLLVPAEELKRFAEQASSQELKVKVSQTIVNALFHPLQTKMACAELPVSCSTPGIEGGFCLFGPQNSALTPDDLKRGRLGSHCDHGAADNGLCKASSKTVGSYEEGKEGSGAEKTTPGNVEEKEAETKAATQMNSMILAVVFAIVMIFP